MDNFNSWLKDNKENLVKGENFLKQYLGEQLHEEYLDWVNNQNLPATTVDDKQTQFGKILNEQIEIRAKQAQEEYLRKVPKKLRQEALVMMPDIFGRLSNLGVEAGREDDSIEFEELYGRPLVKKEYMKGRDRKYKLFIPPQDKSFQVSFNERSNL